MNPLIYNNRRLWVRSPKKYLTRKNGKFVGFMIDTNHFDEIHLICEREETNPTKFLRELIEEYLENNYEI